MINWYLVSKKVGKYLAAIAKHLHRDTERTMPSIEPLQRQDPATMCSVAEGIVMSSYGSRIQTRVYLATVLGI